MVNRNRANGLENSWSYIVLLRDKLLFYIFMKNKHLPVPEIFAVVKNGQLYDNTMQIVPWESISKETDYFIKDVDGECASFVRHISVFGDLEKLKGELQRGVFILQRRVMQHEGIKAINPGAINTLRVITINKNDNPYVLSVLLRVGTKKTGNVDNWAAGGLAIGVEDDGHLKKYGYYKPVHGLKPDVHPDTGFLFSEFQIPMYKQALEMACKAHRHFYGIRAIGWDIAISEDVPVFIEGNDNFEISLQQACDRPLKKEWIEACE